VWLHADALVELIGCLYRNDWHVVAMLKLIWWAVIGLFRSRVSLEAEILTLRHQLI
jgi:hypothetical protein